MCKRHSGRGRSSRREKLKECNWQTFFVFRHLQFRLETGRRRRSVTLPITLTYSRRGGKEKKKSGNIHLYRTARYKYRIFIYSSDKPLCNDSVCAVLVNPRKSCPQLSSLFISLTLMIRELQAIVSRYFIYFRVHHEHQSEQEEQRAIGSHVFA